jgi:spermidine synthase
MQRSPTLVYLIFVLSGAAGLIYEIVWARQLVLVFGNTTQAVSAILTGFFGGMAIGSVVGGRIADRVRSPLRMYGVLELTLVVVVLLTPLTFQLIHELYRGGYAALQEQPQVLALLRFALALLALAPATVMMGATLPTLTRHFRGDDHLSGAFGRLYALNTLGAIVGTLVAGVVLIELLGLTGALVVGAACSGVAGLVAVLLSRGLAEGARSDAPPERLEGERPAGMNRPMLALAVAFVSGLTSLGYQTIWTRLLASGTGSSTYVFTVILGLFLLGLAIGAFLFGRLRHRRPDWLAVLAICQLLTAGLATLGLVFVISRPELVSAHDLGAVFRTLWAAAVSVVLPTTIVMGLAFPASSALLEDKAGRVATAAGQLLAVNTFGAICGTFLLPFVVIPAIGSPAALVLLALVNVATGLALAGARLRGGLRVGVAVAGLAVALAIGIAFTAPGVIVDPSVARIRAAGGQVHQTAEDEIASTQAGQVGGHNLLWVGGTTMTLLTVDAKVMPIAPLMLRPDAEKALTVAFGMGSSFRTALLAGMEVDAVELVPAVPTMFGWFYDDASQVLANPRGDVIISDGRNHVELTNERYDIIVTDPPPPIESSGVSVISSYEYYVAGRERLTEGGVMMQWMPNGQNVEELKAHLRSFDEAFTHVMVAFGPGGFGYLLLGSEAQLEFHDDDMRAALARPGVLEDLASAFDSPELDAEGWIELIRSLVLVEGDEVARLTGDGPLITDDRPLPEYFVLRRAFGPDSPDASRELVRSLAEQARR